MKIQDLVLVSKFSKYSGYKSNRKEPIVVVYSSNGQSINEIIQISITSKNKAFRNNFHQKNARPEQWKLQTLFEKKVLKI